MLKATDDVVSRSWIVSKRQGAAYTSGAISVVNANTVACLCSERIALLDIDSGLVKRFLPEDGSVSFIIEMFSCEARRIHVFFHS